MATTDLVHAPIQLDLNGKDSHSLTTPMKLIEMAVGQNADIDKLGKLLDLQLRWEANEAKKAFVEAMNAFKRNPPTITKNKHVEFGNTKFDHATLDHVCEEVIKGLSPVGISHRWTVEQSEQRVKVTCVLTHQAGHSEATTLEGPADSSGSKNAIQSIGSAVTYLERYTLLAATGLAAQGQDDDGSGSGPKYDEMPEALDNIANSRNLEELQQQFANGYKAAKKIGDTNAMKRLIFAKDERKKELQ